MPSTDAIQLILILKATTALVVETSVGNLSTRRSCFTNGMAARAELDRVRSLRAKCKSLNKTTLKHH